jgi:GT2 family glycosyltransferase/glycosyltransferase involved in cell wall biosynthesis
MKPLNYRRTRFETLSRLPQKILTQTGMIDFNPLDYPCSLSYPLRLVRTAWAAHVPFAMFLIDALRPARVVELGTFSGVSYCAFCQAVKELKLSTRCYAIDTWQGDEQSGRYGAEILADLKAHHDPLYESFSILVESTFDEALAQFEDGTIDLLHIDGYHAYAAVRHDFESWLPKMSPRGVMLFHDTNERERDFGVWKLWEELKPTFPHFEFAHEHGLGLIVTGDCVPENLRPLLEADAQQAALIRQFFSQLGQRLKVRLEKEHRIETLSWEVQDREETIRALHSELAAREQKTSVLNREAQLTRAAMDSELAAREQKINSLARESLAAQEEFRKELEARERSIESLSTALAAKENYLRDILNSKAWRWVKRYWRIKHLSSQTLAGLFRRPRSLRRAAEADQIIRQPPPHSAGQEESLTLLPAPRPEELEAVLNRRATTATLHRPDIICFSLIDWEFRYQRPQQLMSQFAAHGHRVFYIRLDDFLSNQARPRFSVKKLKENLYELRLAALRHQWVNLETIERENGAALLRSLEELRLALRIDEAIGYVQIPSWANVALAARERWGWHIIYDCMDEWKDFPGLGSSITTIEPQLVEECDLVVVASQRLYDKWRATDRPPDRPLLLARNAVDYDFYVERCRPNDLLKAEAGRPVIGYYGAIAGWFDIELLTYVARARPRYVFVLLGGVFDVDTSELESLPNVRLLGQRPYEEMPQFLYHFDVCLIPFKVNRTTEATDPVKMYEYLSAGKPVVSVALSELEPFRDYLYLSADREDFLAQLDRAVAEDDPEMAARRRRFAAEHTWPERYRAITGGLSGATPRASIVVVTYQNPALTKLCLESIIRNTEYPNYELVVVDNDSSDGTADYLRQMAAEHAHIRLVLNSQNEGFARANNLGIARATGEYLVLLNNDTIVPPGWLSRLLRHLRDTRVGMVGPLTNFAGNEAGIDVPYRTYAEMLAFAAEHTWAHDRLAADIRVLAMFCVALRRETYDAVGPLDEQFRIGMFEDDDYTHRLRVKGYRVVCAADVFVHHFGQAAFKTLIERGEYDKLFEENRRRYESKWNLKWTPHTHGSLSFERMQTSLFKLSAQGWDDYCPPSARTDADG